MSLVIPIGGWVNLSGGRGKALKIRGVVKKIELCRSPVVTPYKSDGGARRSV